LSYTFNSETETRDSTRKLALTNKGYEIYSNELNFMVYGCLLLVAFKTVVIYSCYRKIDRLKIKLEDDIRRKNQTDQILAKDIKDTNQYLKQV
jgi:hypothetical protein